MMMAVFVCLLVVAVVLFVSFVVVVVVVVVAVAVCCCDVDRTSQTRDTHHTRAHSDKQTRLQIMRVWCVCPTL